MSSGPPPRIWARAAFSRGSSASPPLWWLCPSWGYEPFACTWAYFRWADDLVDAPDRCPDEVRAFVAHQRLLLEGERPAELLPERALEAALAHPRLGSALRRASRPMLAALAFDAQRGPGPLPAATLLEQQRRIGEGFARAVWACTGAGEEPAQAAIALATAATAAHQLRDLEEDLAIGYNNVPQGAWAGLCSPTTRAWVVRQALELDQRFERGLAELTGVPWRTRLALTALAWRYRRGLRAWSRPAPWLAPVLEGAL